MLPTLPCFVEFHILVIGHLWQHYWMINWLWSAIGAVDWVCWWIPARRGGCLFLPCWVDHSKTRGMPLFPDLVIDGSIVEKVSEFKILGVIHDFKLAYEKQVTAIAASTSRKVGILKKTMSVFRDVALVAKCFRAFIIPELEYCSPVWMSAATSHLLLLDWVVGRVNQLSAGWKCQLWSLAQT